MPMWKVVNYSTFSRTECTYGKHIKPTVKKPFGWGLAELPKICNINMFTEIQFKGDCMTIIYNKSKQFVFGEGPTDNKAYFP